MLSFNITNPGMYISGLLTSQEANYVTNLVNLSYATGDLLYYNGSEMTRLPAGTNTHVLTMVGGVPIWAAPSGGGGGGITDGDKTDITVSSLGAVWTVDADINKTWTGLHRFNNYIDIGEITAPATPPTDTVRLYSVDDQSNTRLQYQLPDGTTVQVARDNIYVVRNREGSTITPGQWVYISGGQGTTGTAEVKLARADTNATIPAFGYVLESIANNAYGRVMVGGKIENQNTSAFTEGDILWLSATVFGAATATKPTHPNLQQRLGVVLNSNASNGSLVIAPVGVRGDNDGTNQNSWLVGDGLAGTKSIGFKNTFQGLLSWTPTASRTITIPDLTGTLALVSDLANFETTTQLNTRDINNRARTNHTGTTDIIGNLTITSVVGGATMTGTGGGSFNITDQVYVPGLNISGQLTFGANNVTNIGTTAVRAAKLWATDAEFTNAPTIGGVAASGSGGLVRTTSPSLTTPTLGVAGATSLGVGKSNSASIRVEVLTNSSFTQGIRVEADNTTRLAFSGFVTGDSNVRFTQNVAGLLEWGPGNAVGDTNLYRSSANTLATDDKFVALGGLKITNVSTIGHVWTATDTIGNGAWTAPSGGGGAQALTITVNQTAHGFTFGKILKKRSGVYELAQANTAENAEVVGMVSSIIDANNFTLLLAGYINTNPLSLSTPDTLFLSATVAGELTEVAPTEVGQISKPLLYTVDLDQAVFVNTRGTINTAPAGSSEVILPNIVSPTTPPSDTAKLFARKVAQRMVPAYIGPSGLDSALQPFLARNKIGYWNPQGNSTAVPGVFGFTAPTAAGTATARNVTTTNGATRMRRLGYVSAATAGSFAEQRVAVAQFSCGSGANDGSGFFYLTRWVPSNAAAVSGERFFIGLRNVTTAGTNVEQNTIPNQVGVAQLSTDSTQYYIVYGGSAAQTAIPCGTALGSPAGLSTDAFELAIFSPNSLLRTFYVQVTNIFTGETFTTTLSGTTTQVPANTTLLAHRAFKTNNATALAVAFDVCSIYVETDT